MTVLILALEGCPGLLRLGLCLLPGSSKQDTSWHDKSHTHLTSHSPPPGPHSSPGTQAGVGTYQCAHFSDGSICAGPEVKGCTQVHPSWWLGWDLSTSWPSSPATQFLVYSTLTTMGTLIFTSGAWQACSHPRTFVLAAPPLSRLFPQVSAGLAPSARVSLSKRAAFFPLSLSPLIPCNFSST